MKQVFNKITKNYEFMQDSTAQALLVKDKVIILEDKSTLPVVIIKDLHIEEKRYRKGAKVSLLTVLAHKWANYGYVSIVKEIEPIKQNEPIKEEKKIELSNKLEKVKKVKTK